MQVEAADLAGRDVDVVRAGEVAGLGRAQEAEAVGQDFQHAVGGDAFAVAGQHLEQREDHVLLAGAGDAFGDVQLLGDVEQLLRRHALEVAERVLREAFGHAAACGRCGEVLLLLAAVVVLRQAVVARGRARAGGRGGCGSGRGVVVVEARLPSALLWPPSLPGLAPCLGRRRPGRCGLAAACWRCAAAGAGCVRAGWAPAARAARLRRGRRAMPVRRAAVAVGVGLGGARFAHALLGDVSPESVCVVGQAGIPR